MKDVRMNKPAAGRTRGAILYIRVSTEEQARHGTSLDSQRDACRAKAMEMGLPVVAEYEDAGVSGAFFDHRENLQRALADIREGRADTLIATELDRLSRDVEHQQKILKTVRAAGGRLVFCAGTFDDTAEGDLNYTFQGGFKEYEKKVIRRRLMNGKRRLAGEGIQAYRGNPPFGYHVPTTADVLRGDYPLDQRGRYILVPEEAEVIRWMFEQYAGGLLTLPGIARAMNERKVPTKRGGLCWRAVNFAFIFQNPVYKGQPVAGRWQSRKDESRLNKTNRLTGDPIVSDHGYWLAPPENWIPLEAPAIVSEEMWDRVQERLGENKTRLGRAGVGGNPSWVRMLSGRVFCPACGTAMTINTSGGNKAGHRISYYVCGRYKWGRQEKGETLCEKTYYPLEETERAALTALLDACERPEAVHAAALAFERAQAPSMPNGTDPRRELAQVDKALAKLADEDALTVRAQMAGMRAGGSPEAYAAVFADLAAQRKDLEDRQGVLSKMLSARLRPSAARKGVRAVPSPDDARLAAIRQTQRVLSSPDITGAEKRRLLGTLIRRVTCRKGGATVWFLAGALGEGEMGVMGPDTSTLQNIRTS